MNVLQVYHVDLSHAAWFSAVPWTMMALLGYFAGAWSDMLIQRGLSVTLTRKIMQVSTWWFCGICLFVSCLSFPMYQFLELSSWSLLFFVSTFDVMLHKHLCVYRWYDTLLRIFEGGAYLFELSPFFHVLQSCFHEHTLSLGKFGACK